MTLSNITGGT
jgi:hypothetical protein